MAKYNYELKSCVEESKIGGQNTDPNNSATIELSNFDKAMQIYEQGSEKYKNALRELVHRPPASQPPSAS